MFELENDDSEVMASALPNRLAPMPDLNLEYIEQSLTLGKPTGDLESELSVLREKASEVQQMFVQEALSNDILNDQRALRAFNEEVPLTSSSLGLINDVDYSSIRRLHEKIVTVKNDIARGLLQCDCCLSQRSHPEKQN